LEALLKVCSKCGEEKPLTDFYKSATSIGGHRSSCKRSTIAWKETNRDRYNELSRNSRTRQRLRVLQIVGRGVLKCSRCGCDATELLEINHINGGGAQEVKRKNTIFYGKILRGERCIDDLNVLCKMCNILHYIELTHGEQNYILTWGKNENSSI
jgi:hypothetical protein